MSLTVENGTNVSGADTYVTLAEARAYALKRGVTLPATDATVEAYIVEACDFLESQAFRGDRTDDHDQPLAWPRTGADLHGDLLDNDEIPQLLKDVQCRLVMDRHNLGSALVPNGTGQEVTSEAISGAVTVSYAPRGSGTVAPELNTALAMLAPLLTGSSPLSLRRL